MLPSSSRPAQDPASTQPCSSISRMPLPSNDPPPPPCPRPAPRPVAFVPSHLFGLPTDHLPPNPSPNIQHSEDHPHPVPCRQHCMSPCCPQNRIYSTFWGPHGLGSPNLAYSCTPSLLHSATRASPAACTKPAPSCPRDFARATPCPESFSSISVRD